MRASRLGVWVSRLGMRASRLGVWASRLGVSASRLGVWVSRLGVWASRLGVWVSRLGVWASRLGVWASRLGVWASHLTAKSLKFIREIFAYTKFHLVCCSIVKQVSLAIMALLKYFWFSQGLFLILNTICQAQ